MRAVWWVALCAAVAVAEHQGTPGGAVPNHNPLFERGADLYVLEDSGVYGPSVWATKVVDGDGPLVAGRPTDSGTQSLQFRFIYTDVTLFDGVQGRPKMADDGLITFIPAPDNCGVATVRVELVDSGNPECVPGVAPSGRTFICPGACTPTDCHVSTQVEFFIEVVCVNDPPSYLNLGNQAVVESSGDQVVDNWAYNIEKGAALGGGTITTFELQQYLTFTASNNNPSLFTAQPRVVWDPSNPGVAHLYFTPAYGVCGAATVTVNLVDNGGTANGGLDTAPPTVFTITVTCKNDKPSFVCGASVRVSEDQGEFVGPNWAQAISSGDDAAQMLYFDLVFLDDGRQELFLIPPSLNPVSGDLTFTAKQDANTFKKPVDIYVRLRDDAGAVSCEPIDECCTLRVIIDPVNDPPSFLCGSSITVCEDLTNLPVAPTPPIFTDGNHWARELNIGAENEGTIVGGEGQEFLFTLTPSNQGLFAAGPSIDTYGTLTFELVPHANGVSSVTVALRDTGSNVPPSSNAAPTCEFMVTVLPVSDPPSFQITAPDPLVATEDASPEATTYPAFASHVSRGPSDEAGQFASFTVTSDNPDMFDQLPVIDLDSASSGTLSFELKEHACGQTTLTIVLRDNGDPSTCGQKGMNSFMMTHTLKVDCANDPPTFDLACASTGCNIVVCEDEVSTGMRPYSTSGFIQNLYAGPVGEVDEDLQSVVFRVSTSNDRLFSTLPEVTPGGTLTFITQPDTYGEALVSVQAVDDGVPPQTTTKQFMVTVQPANDPPSFEVQGDLLGTTVQECYSEYGPNCSLPAGDSSCSRVFPMWVFNVKPSDSDNLLETDQTVTFKVLVDQATERELFDVSPTVDTETGTLRFTTKLGASTTTPVALQIVATDSLDTNKQCGGVGTTSKTIMLSINSVNWPPCFTCGPPVIVKEDQGQVTFTQHAQHITAGPYVEDITQVKTFTLVPSQPELFLEAPRVDPSTGTLYFVTSSDYCGETDVLVQLDDGEALNSKHTCSFHISVTPVNDAPWFTHADTVSLNEDAGRHCVEWVHDSGAGNMEGRPGGKCDQQAIAFHMDVVDNEELFLEVPTLDAGTGDLCFRAKDDVCGIATFEVWISDDGGTADGGIDTSARVRSQVDIACINDAPTFIRGSDISVCEDQNAHFVYQWCAAHTPGPDNEQGQVLTFNVANDNPDLFLVQPHIIDCSLYFTPAFNAFGTASVTVDLCDDGEKSWPHVNCADRVVVNINVLPVNDAPHFVHGGDVTVQEDSGPHVIPTWAKTIARGGNPSGIGTEQEQDLTFTLTAANAALFSRPPSVDAIGDLTFALTADATGQSEVTACLQDTGGVGPPPSTIAPISCPNGADTYCTTFTITVFPCNDPPSFTGASAIEVNEDAGRTTIASWITGLSAGPGEHGQAFIKAAVEVPVDKRYLFSELPIVSTTTGDLTFTTSPNVVGSVVVTLVIRDDGGTAGNGCFDVLQHSVTITVLPVNDVPSFVPGIDVSVPEDSPTYREPWASKVSAGPFEDYDQTVSFIVTNSNPMLFTEQPAMDPNGVLSFTPRSDMHGESVVSVQLHDGAGDFSTSEPVTFTITVRPVNDPAAFVRGPDITVAEGSGTWCEKAWATGISSGTGEQPMTLTFTVTPRCCETFFAAPATIDPVTGDMCMSIADNVFGVVTLDVVLSDNGVNIDQGSGQSAPQAVQLTITPVNDPPFFVPSGTLQVLEDAGLQTATNHMKLISAGPFEEQQVLQFMLSPDPVGLFVTQPEASALTGDVTFETVPDANGEATVVAVLRDDGGGDNTYTDQFAIRILSVNDAPTFVSGPDVEAHEDAGVVTVPAWASNLLPGPPDELGQQLTFVVTPNSPSLFATMPSVAVPSGDLTFALKPNAHGTAGVGVVLKDNGGVANGGADTSASVVFTVTVNAVNDAPEFTAGPPNIVLQTGSGLYTSQWAASIRGGPEDESQEVTFRVSTTQEELFTVLPAVDNEGVLSFGVREGVEGEATIVVIAVDSEGATSVPRSVRLSVVPDPPTVIRAVLNQEYASFSYTRFISTIAESLQVPEERVLVTKIEPGSVVVDFLFTEGVPSSKVLTDMLLERSVELEFRERLALLEAYPKENIIMMPPGGGGGGGLDGAYVAIIVIVVVVVVVAAVVGFVMCLRRRTREEGARENEAASAASSLETANQLSVVAKSAPPPPPTDSEYPEVQENPLQHVFSATGVTQPSHAPHPSYPPYDDEGDSDYTDSIIIYPESPEAREARLG